MKSVCKFASFTVLCLIALYQITQNEMFAFMPTQINSIQQAKHKVNKTNQFTVGISLERLIRDYNSMALNATNYISTLTLTDVMDMYNDHDGNTAMDTENVCTQNDTRKIFLLGFMKCGTGSFNVLFESIGCHTLHRLTPTNQIIGKVMYRAYENQNKLLAHIPDRFNAFTQIDNQRGWKNVWPQILFFQLLYEQYPDSLFILNYKNITNHIKSINHWGNLRKRLRNFNIPGLPKGKGKYDNDIRLWMLNHYYNVIMFFSHLNATFLKYDIENDNITKLETFLHRHDLIMPHVDHRNTTM